MNRCSISVQVDIDSPISVRIDEQTLERAAVAAIEARQADIDAADTVLSLNVTTEYAVHVVVTADEQIQRLNKDFRGVDRPTDVLSFAFVAGHTGPPTPLPDGWPVDLGQIVLSYPYAERQARELDHSIDLELAWLTVHGTLQLLGYTHDHEFEAEHMEGLEAIALRRLGFSKEPGPLYPT